jgi:hypothetical protein
MIAIVSGIVRLKMGSLTADAMILKMLMHALKRTLKLLDVRIAPGLIHPRAT